MPITPNTTLTADLQSILGAGAGDGGASLDITLCGFGPFMPSVSSVGVLADAGTPMNVAQVGNTPISQLLWGNDQITPGNTFYSIAVKGPNGNVVQCGNYQFIAPLIGNQDLSTLQPNFPQSYPPRFLGYVPMPFSATPIFSGALGNVFDITLTGNVTASTLTAVAPGGLILFFIQQDATGNWTFTWPANVKNPPVVDNAPGSTTTAGFIMRNDGNAYPFLGWN